MPFILKGRGKASYLRPRPSVAFQDQIFRTCLVTVHSAASTTSQDAPSFPYCFLLFAALTPRAALLRAMLRTQVYMYLPVQFMLSFGCMQ